MNRKFEAVLYVMLVLVAAMVGHCTVLLWHLMASYASGEKVDPWAIGWCSGIIVFGVAAVVSGTHRYFDIRRATKNN